MLSLTPSHIIEYLFCPRFSYFEYVLRIPQYEGKFYKVRRGRAVHQQKTTRNPLYLRKKLGVLEKYTNQYLTNELLRGEVDEVLLLADETMAPLDYKFAVYEDRIYDTYKTQLYCYAWLIQTHFGAEVNKGYLVYTRSRSKVVEVSITNENISSIQQIAQKIRKIIQQNRYPKATKYKKRCVSCSYRNICIR
ncbi:MAG: CRISPR-associated protein Cas4 [Saprospiraceae bacterium]|nr:CRISPR-associated protein Cas4 [Saprospiraceae bacterium]